MTYDLGPDIGRPPQDNTVHPDGLSGADMALEVKPLRGGDVQETMAHEAGDDPRLEVKRHESTVPAAAGRTATADSVELTDERSDQDEPRDSGGAVEEQSGNNDRDGQNETDEVPAADGAGGDNNDGGDGGNDGDGGETNGGSEDWSNRIVTVRESPPLPDVPWISLGENAAPEDADISTQVAEVREYQRAARSAIATAVGVTYPLPTRAIAERYTALGLSCSPSICITPDRETLDKISEYDGGAMNTQGSDYGANDTHGAYSTALDTGFVFLNNVITPRVAAVTAAHEGGNHASEEQEIILTTKPDGTRAFVAIPAVEQSTANQEIRHEWTAGLVGHDIYGRAGTLAGTHLEGHEVPARLALRGQTTDVGFTWGQMAIDATIYQGGRVDEGLFNAYLAASKSAEHKDELYDRLHSLAPAYVDALEVDMYADPVEAALAARDLCLRFTDRNDPQAAVRAATAVEELFRRAVHR